jgi:hypothetical protein
MAGAERRKCKCCHKLFRPDPRNRRHHRYCTAPSCRSASKAASQARWLAAPENRFRGPVNVARVRAWRSRPPGYWRAGVALQDLSLAQDVDSTNKTVNFRTPCATRDHIGATRCSDWLNRPYRGDTTRGDRPDHRPFATAGPRQSRFLRGSELKARS